jgi:hypothetical protein
MLIFDLFLRSDGEFACAVTSMTILKMNS